MFIKYEEFNTNQGKVLRDVFNFLGVDPNFSYPERVIENKRKKHASITPKDKRYLIDLFRDDIEKLSRCWVGTVVIGYFKSKCVGV